MKTFAASLLCLVATGFACFGLAPAQGPEKDAERMLKTFYTAYLTVFATESGKAGEKKLAALQQQFCTPAFVQRIPALIRQTEADPFLKAQDSSLDYLKTLSIAKTPGKHKYRVSYVGDAELNKKETVVMLVTVAPEKNGFKIAAVE
jgi:hypothetical protein